MSNLHLRHKGPSYKIRRGLRYEDEQRIVKVVLVDRDTFGIFCERKGKDAHSVKFGVSRDGAKILSRQLQQALRGKVKRWREPNEYQWQLVIMADEQFPEGVLSDILVFWKDQAKTRWLLHREPSERPVDHRR